LDIAITTFQAQRLADRHFITAVIWTIILIKRWRHNMTSHQQQRLAWVVYVSRRLNSVNLSPITTITAAYLGFYCTY